MKEYIELVAEGKDLTEEQAKAAMEILLSGEASQAQIGAFLMGLRMKGETLDELTGFAGVLRDKADTISPKVSNYVDLVGTGGDCTYTFNVSTTSAFVVAAAGLPVALDSSLIGALAGGGILIPCRQHQLYLILLCGLGHFAVGCGSLGFQRNAGGIIGHGQLRRRLFRQGKVCIHQHEALIRKVRLRTALILPGLEGRRRCDEGIGPGQQPEDAAGHHSHDRAAAEQKDRPVAHEADTVSPAAFFQRQSAAGCGSILLHDAASFLFLTFALDTGI